VKIKHACTLQNRLSILAAGLLVLTTLSLSSLFCKPVAAASTISGSYHMIVNGRSFHMDKPRKGEKYNENNFGSGIQYEFGRNVGSNTVPFITSSAFYDSYNNLSYYVGGGESRRFFLTRGWHADIGYVGFMMARKDIGNYSPFPGVLPVASLGTRDVSLNMTYVPPLKKGFAELIFFQLKIATPDW